MLAQNLLWKNIDELWAFLTDILGDGTKRVLISAVWYWNASSWMVITTCVLTPLRHISSGSQPDKCPANCFLARKSLLSHAAGELPPLLPFIVPSSHCHPSRLLTSTQHQPAGPVTIEGVGEGKWRRMRGKTPFISLSPACSFFFPPLGPNLPQTE